MNFDKAVELVGIHEGGLSLDPTDRGNWNTGRVSEGELKGTKFGISSYSYPHLDIVNITWSQAKSIYLRDFWNKYRIGELPANIRLFALDSIINHGPAGGVKLLQRAAKITQDGIIGPATIKISHNVTPWDFAQARSDYYIEITQNGFNDDNDRTQLKGWLRRNLRVLKESLS